MNSSNRLILLILFSPVFAGKLPHFTVIVPTYKNAAFCIQNIQTLAEQTYTDWNALIMVDGQESEDDGTAAQLEQFVADNHLENKVTIIKVNERRKALHNIYTAAMSIEDPESVIVMYDGDDYFYSSKALEIIAHEYSHHDAWLTYGQYINIPANTLGNCKPFPAKVMKKKSI